MLKKPPPGTLALMLLHAVVWLLAQPMEPAFGRATALVPDAVLRGEVWRLLTYALEDNLRGVLFTLLALYFFGAAVEREQGRRRVWMLWGVSTVVVGTVFTLLGLAFHKEVLNGADAAALALLAAFAAQAPRSTIMMNFVLPVQAIHMVWLAVLIKVLSCWEIQAPVWALLTPLLALPLGWLLVRPGAWRAWNPRTRLETWRMKRKLKKFGVVVGGANAPGPEDYLQ